MLGAKIKERIEPKSLEVRQRVFKYEPLVLVVLGLHGVLASLFLGGQPWYWAIFGLVFLLAVVGWRYPQLPLSIRVTLLIIISWLLLWQSGGVGSFFLLWYFVIVAFYPLVLRKPTNFIVAVAIALVYLLLLPFSEAQIPVFVVGARAFLLLFIGWVVAILGNNLVDYATEQQRSEENLRRVFRVSPSAITVSRLEDGRCLDVNEHFLELTGYTREQIVGHTAAEVDIWPDVEARQRFLEGVQTAGYIHDYETLYRRQSGEMGLMVLNAEILELNGEACLVTFARDVTESRQAEEQIHYQADLLDKVSEAIISTDEKFIIKSWNKAAEALYGWRAEEIIGQNITKVIPIEYYEATAAEVEAAFFENGSWHGEVIQGTKDEETRYVFSAVSLITDQENRPIGAVAVNRDISKQKELQEALQLQEAQYRAVVEGQTELLSRHLPDTTITFVNEAYCRYFGLSREELLGKKLDELLWPSLVEAIKRKFTRLTLEHPMEMDEHLEKRADGRVRWLQWTDKGIFDENGRLLEIQSVGRDITPLKEAQTQLQHVIDTVPEGVLLLDGEGYIRLANPIAEQYLSLLAPDREDGRLQQLGNQPLDHLLTSPPKGLWHEIVAGDSIFEAMARPVEHDHYNTHWVLVVRDITQERHIQRRIQEQERLAAVGQLAAGIAHDFNNILAVIILYAQMISRSSMLTTHTQERVDIIHQQAQRATELVQQVLDYSRQSVLKRQPLDLVPFLNELMRLLNRTLPETIQIDFEHEADEYLIFADLGRMQQVVVNLAVNARDAMLEGGRLTLTLSQVQIGKHDVPPLPGLPNGSWVVLAVTDSGTGITPEIRSRIFEPFFTTKDTGKGTGLGLAQVYGIVQQHEGHVDVKTEMDKGTTFLLYFPAFLTGEAAVLPPHIPMQLGQDETILVVEDNDIARQALVDTLQFLNYQTIEAKNGREALTILTNTVHDIRLILSDVTMPNMGGIALFQSLQEHDLMIPVLLLTGHPMGQEIESLQAQGLAGWLPKPPNIEKLAQLVTAALQNR